MKTAIIFTTFMRPELAKMTIASIKANLPDDSVLCVVEQGNELEADIHLPYDVGLSAARNAGVTWAYEQAIPWCMITADSIQFTKKYDFNPHIHSGYDLIGFDLENRVPYEGELWFNMDAGWPTPFKINKDYVPKINGIYSEIDICRNFFIAKTEALHLVKWDDELKLCEHEDFFYRFKQAQYSCAWTDSVQATYIDDKPEDYEKMRNRMYTEFRGKVRRKYERSIID